MQPGLRMLEIYQDDNGDQFVIGTFPMARRHRHRKEDRSRKGNSDARIASDPRKLTSLPAVWTKYSGDFLKYIVRPKNGVGRPPLVGRDRLIMQEIRRWGYTHPRVAALAVRLSEYEVQSGAAH